MSPDERIELLKAVAACAPKGMGVTFHETYSGRPFRVEVDLDASEDADSAIFTFAMLDEIEKAGFWCDLLHGDDQHYVTHWNKSGQHWFTAERGKTRAEAVARAFVKVFESTEAK